MCLNMPVRFVALALGVLILPTSASGQSIVGILGIPAEVAAVEKRLENVREVPVQGCAAGCATW
jgi:hypothetical protein